jgi:DNA-binding CsgD family transcriptional regulator
LGTVQDISDQRVSERELRAHHAVSQALREWEAFDQGVIDLLGLMATALEYQMASLWLWDQGLRALYCRAFWSEPGRDAAQFELAKRSMNFRPGEGKPGCAWQTQKPVVTPDAATDPVFQPRDAAVMGGIKSSLAFPALGPDGPIAVLSFYGFEHRTVSDSLTRTLSAIGHELGNFLSTRRDELDPRPLTPRELEVLRVAAEGNTGPQIAASLFISPATVKTHFDNIYEKLGVSDRAAAVAQAIRLGLIR